MISPSRPLRIPDTRRATSTGPDAFFSKSLDMYGGVSMISERARNVHSPEISSISHAGYLLKRSNQALISPPLFSGPPPGVVNTLVSMTKSEERFASGVGERDDLTSPDHVHEPQHLFLTPSPTNASNNSTASNNSNDETGLGLNFLANLFGFELPEKAEEQQPPFPALHDLNHTTIPKRSAPIKMLSSENQNEDIYAEPQKTHSLSSMDYSAKPRDETDKDGHIWKANYCLLSRETLYFYSTKEEAESPHATQERQRVQEDSDSDLSHSPIPRNHLAWEKRVQLESVEAVRSAVEYGPHSFELSAGDEEKLVLRAKSADEMNEWIFQFHRCIASFVRDMMMEHVEPAPRARIGDIHHPTFQTCDGGATNTASSDFLSYPSPGRQQQRCTITAASFGSSLNAASFSPRYHRMITNAGNRPTPLSHGHGRLRRRRETSTSQSPELPFPTLPGRSFRMVTPTLAARSPDTSTNLASFPQQRGAAIAVAVDTSERNDPPEPEVCSPKTEDPETERPPPAKGKYVPPHLRRSATKPNHVPRSQTKYVPPHQRNNNSSIGHAPPSPDQQYIPRRDRQENPGAATLFTPLQERTGVMPPRNNTEARGSIHAAMMRNDEDYKHFKLGGCADPLHVPGSIMDEQFIPRKASKLKKVQTQPFGYTSSEHDSGRLRWEIGCVSECGVREFNEDSFLVTSDLVKAFATVDKNHCEKTIWDQFSEEHAPGLFCIFDGHCGDQASRFASERLTRFIYEESSVADDEETGQTSAASVEDILGRAIHRLDEEFCNLCVAEERAWESGSTALIVALVDEHMVIANLGDARGIMGRSFSVDHVDDVSDHKSDGWNELPFDDYTGARRCLWKEVTDVHSPNKESELARIVQANGWVTTEQEIPLAQLKRMAFDDDDVIDLLKRSECQQSPKASAPHRVLQIARVCGELGVSRSLGDRDFKASYNKAHEATGGGSSEHVAWDSLQLLLDFPDGHSGSFVGDLVSSKPEFLSLRVGESNVSEEFLLMACDGLWDVIDADDAYRVTRSLLFEKHWPAKKAAGRLAELAVHLGSSDNITIIVVRLIDRSPY